jgi:putative peptidoglycan lipid II flippase
LLSRGLGLVRDIVLTLLPSASRDAFFLAFRLPNMFRDLVGEGAANAAFIPVYSETLAKKSEAEFRELVSAAMSAMLLILAAMTAAGVFLMPYVLQGITRLEAVTGTVPPSPGEIASMISLARWTFPYLFFIGLATFAMGPLMSSKRYGSSSWSPALLNVSLIATCLLFRGRFADPAYALVLGVWLGGLAQFGVQYLSLGMATGVWLPNFKLGHPRLAVIFGLLIPVLLGQAAGEVNKLVDALFAASLGEGTQSALWYSNRLIQLPLAVFGIATSVAILPSLSQSAAREELAEMRHTLLHGFRQSFFLVFPAMLGLMVMSRPLTNLLFEWNDFGANDTLMTSTALVYYGAGLLSFVWIKVAVTGFFAMKDTRTPVVIASASMLLNIGLNFLLVGPMQYRGLALATTISFSVNMALLLVFLARRIGLRVDRESSLSLVKTAVAATVMAAIAWLCHWGLATMFSGDEFYARILATLGPIAVAVGVYAAVCRLLHVPELGHFLAGIRSRQSQ